MTEARSGVKQVTKRTSGAGKVPGRQGQTALLLALCCQHGLVACYRARVAAAASNAASQHQKLCGLVAHVKRRGEPAKHGDWGAQWA